MNTNPMINASSLLDCCHFHCRTYYNILVLPYIFSPMLIDEKNVTRAAENELWIHGAEENLKSTEIVN